MPIYEFQCSQCNKCFETLIRKQADQNSLACPACGNKDLEKLLSSCGLISRGENTDGSSSSPSRSSCDSCKATSCSTCH
ncbi:zinc ribbon domain-containing protein [Planctomycetota bacterium]